MAYDDHYYVLPTHYLYRYRSHHRCRNSSFYYHRRRRCRGRYCYLSRYRGVLALALGATAIATAAWPGSEAHMACAMAVLRPACCGRSGSGVVALAIPVSFYSCPRCAGVVALVVPACRAVKLLAGF